MHKRTFFAAKVNVHANIFSQNLDEIIKVHIPRVVLESKPTKIHSWNWSFTDVEKVTLNDQSLIIGNVTKSKFTKQKVKIGDKTERRTTDYELAHTAFFVYDPLSEILAHESTGAISAHEFRVLFTKLLSSDPYIGEVIINPIPVPQKIREEFLAIEKITNVQFNLIHPNPGKKEFNLYQDIINDAKLKELNIQMENKEGFEVRETEEKTGKIIFKKSIENGISLVESGYGSIDVKGFDNKVIQGKKKPRVHKDKKGFSSSKSVRHINIKEPEQKKLLERLFSFIKLSKNKLNGDGDDLGL
jgi:hypothetical protein